MTVSKMVLCVNGEGKMYRNVCKYVQRREKKDVNFSNKVQMKNRFLRSESKKSIMKTCFYVLNLGQN